MAPVAHLGSCAYCGLLAIEDIATAIALRKIGETIYCDVVCRTAATSLTRLFDEPEIERCRHLAKAPDGHCLDCGAADASRRRRA